MNIHNTLDWIENLRRESYVKSVLRASESDDVVGYIGSNIPIEIFYSMGLMAIPVYGVDAEILQYSHEKNLCSVIDATLTYANTDKCPLIHSSKIVILENCCPLMTRKLSSINKFYVYDYDDASLISTLENVYSKKFDTNSLNHSKSQLEQISLLLERIKYYSDLSGLDVFILEYYIKFLELDEQVNILQEVSDNVTFYDEKIGFIPVRVQNGAGIYRQIDNIFSGKNYRIIEDFCNIHADYDFVYENCPYSKGKKIRYE